MDSLADKCTNANAHKHGPHSNWPRAPGSYHAFRSHPGQSDFSTRGSPTDSILLAFSFSLEMAEILNPFSYTLLLPLSNIFFSHWSKEKKAGPRGKESTHHWRRSKRCGFNLWVRKIPWRRACNPLQFLPEDSHGERSLVGYSPQGHRVRHNWSGLACKRKAKQRPVGLPGTHGHHH